MKKEISRAFCRAAALALAGCLLIPMTGCQSGSPASDPASGNETQAAQTQPAEQDIWLKVKTEEFGETGEPASVTTYEYDGYGRLTRTLYEEDPDYGPDTTRTETTYSYSPEGVRAEKHSVSTMTSGLGYVRVTERIEYYNEYGIRTSAAQSMTTDYTEDPSKESTRTESEIIFFSSPDGKQRANVQKNLDDHTCTFRVSDNVSSKDTSEKTYDGDLLVKKVSGSTAYEYEYDENNNLSELTTIYNYGTDNAFSMIEKYTYELRTCQTDTPVTYPPSEDMDVIVEAPTFDPSGQLLYTYRYGYDVYGNQAGAYATSADGTPYGDEYNEYNADGQVIRVWTDELISDMTYNDKGQRVREDYRLDPDAEVVVHADCEYDEAGNLIRLTTHADDPDYSDAEGNVQEYEYDENGQLLYCRNYDASGALLAYDAYTYTEDGKISKIDTYDGNDNLAYTTQPQYETIAVLATED